MVVKLLLAKCVKLESKDCSGCTPLLLVVKNRHKIVIKLLLKKGAKPDLKEILDGLMLLLLIAESGYKAAVQLLLKRGTKFKFKDTLI